MNTDRIYNAIILNEPYAGKVMAQIKKIETRMKRLGLVGDLVICCDKGKSKLSPNAGNALCIVEVTECRDMTPDDEKDACIECIEGRKAFPMTNWRYFSMPFKFTQFKVSGSYQSIFQIRIPDYIKIIND